MPLKRAVETCNTIFTEIRQPIVNTYTTHIKSILHDISVLWWTIPSSLCPTGATERDLSPGGATENDLSPGGATEKDLSPRGATEKDLSPRGATEQDLSPRGATEKDLSPRGATEQVQLQVQL